MTVQNELLKHEVVHGSHIILCMFDDYIATHPYVIENKILEEKAEKISELLMDFYKSVNVSEQTK